MPTDLVAHASVNVNAPRSEVWDALVSSESLKEYMFGADVVSDWREGSSIVWKGEWQGKRYVDNGTILEIDPPRRLRFTHFSPLSGLADEPENYHTVTIELAGDDGKTRVTLTQDNNTTAEAREHSERNWQMMLMSLKKFLEQ
jgi:uncharacterized protein YndB with AHSA1/START domain